MSKCIVCDEKYNNSTHLCVKCEYCQFETCRTCCEQYVSNEGAIKCMNKDKNDKGELICDKQWTRRYLAKYMTKQFMIKDYKKIREKIVRDSEFAKLPETMPYVEAEMKSDKIKEKIVEINNTIQQLFQKKNAAVLALNTLGTRLTNTMNTNIFTRSCPAENCRGFLNSSWKCGLCSVYTCKECYILKYIDPNVEHVCKPDDIATASLLSKDTKQCPKCSTGIFKIDGCDQMWCTQCHTAFSWKTGRVEKTIHNPHYYEYLRKTTGSVPRAPGDVLCDVNAPIVQEDMNRLIRLLNEFKKIKKLPIYEEKFYTICDTFILLVQSKNHLSHYQAPAFNRNTGLLHNRHLRMAYLKNKMDETVFVEKIQRVEKDGEKRHEIYNVLTMFDTVISDLLKRSLQIMYDVNDKNKPHKLPQEIVNNLENILKEVDTIVIYSNDLLKEISSAYNNKQYKIQLFENTKSQITNVLV